MPSLLGLRHRYTLCSRYGYARWSGSLQTSPYHFCHRCSCPSLLGCSQEFSLKPAWPNKLCKRRFLPAWPFWTERTSSTMPPGVGWWPLEPQMSLPLTHMISWERRSARVTLAGLWPQGGGGDGKTSSNIKKKKSIWMSHYKVSLPKETSPQNLSRRTLMSCLKIHANVGIRRYRINLLF